MSVAVLDLVSTRAKSFGWNPPHSGKATFCLKFFRAKFNQTFFLTNSSQELASAVLSELLSSPGSWLEKNNARILHSGFSEWSDRAER